MKFSITTSARRASSKVSRAPSGAQVDGDPALVAVDRREDRAHPGGAAQSPQVVAAAGTLELDDVRAEIAEEHRAVRAGDDAGQVEDAQALEHPGRRHRSR
jgi:hypothetical protein